MRRRTSHAASGRSRACTPCSAARSRRSSTRAAALSTARQAPSDRRLGPRLCLRGARARARAGRRRRAAAGTRRRRAAGDEIADAEDREHFDEDSGRFRTFRDLLGSRTVWCRSSALWRHAAAASRRAASRSARVVERADQREVEPCRRSRPARRAGRPRR